MEKLKKTLLAIALLVAVWGTLKTIDTILDSTSETYHQITMEIDQHDIDTGNAMNFFGDETSGYAVFEIIQTMEHPPHRK